MFRSASWSSVADMKSCAVLGVGFQALAGGWGLALWLGACGGGAVEPKNAEAAPSASSAPVAPAAASSAAAPVSDAAATEPEEKAEAAEPAPKAKDPNAIREIKYVVAPEGLRIEVAGVRFLAAAEAKRVAQGWGAKLTVKAEVTDGKPHVLLNPKNGPLAFAAAVFKKGSTEAERIPDSRQGDAELSLAAGSPTSFAREFPGKGGRVLAIGETLDMEVALWGLGETSDDRRPVKQLFHVKMKVEKGKPKAFVEPPASAAK